ncbi:DNA methyltransferase [Prevotella pectinovora]|uniref:DNA methyltransferase n=1 Tax=Prevotella pectinovora TaxID=1602169 RepID=UPI00307FEE8C
MRPFAFPKPSGLVKFLLSTTVTTLHNATILDFFAGSGTTLHATMQLNAEDGGHRKCILVTNNENNICEEVTYERNKRVIQGYTTPKGEEVEGLHDNNLRYYRTNFLSRDKSVKNMRQLVRLATDMLCIKNDVYTEAEFCGKKINPNIARYFDNGQGNRMLVIYEERAIQLLVQLTAQTEDDGIKTMVYVFSPGADPYTDDFEDIAERVKLCALPSAIYEAYKRVLPKRKPKFLDEALQEMKAQAEAEANVQQTLDFGENDNMNEEGGEA